MTTEHDAIVIGAGSVGNLLAYSLAKEAGQDQDLPAELQHLLCVEGGDGHGHRVQEGRILLSGISAPVKQFLGPLVVDLREGSEGKTINFYLAIGMCGQGFMHSTVSIRRGTSTP